MDNKIIQKLTDLANPNAMTSKEFIANYKIIIDHVKEIKKMLAGTANNLKGDFDKKKSELDAKTEAEINKIKLEGQKELANVTTKLNTFEKRIIMRLSELKDGKDGDKGEDGKDGQDADEEKIVNDVLDKLNFDDVKEEIKDLRAMIAEYDEKIASVRRMRGGGTGGTNQAVQYADLTDQVDGVKKTFTIPTARMVVQLTGTQYPIIYRPVIDYTVGNKTITLTDEVSAPESGQSLTILYIK